MVVHSLYDELTLSQCTATRDRSTRAIYGVLGILSLSACDYLILITARERRGLIFGHIVYRATDFAILPIAPPPAPDHPAERHLLALVRTHLKTGAFWFSYGWDLTTRLQNQRPNDTRPLWEQATDRFFWNKYLHTRLIDMSHSDSSQDCSEYILPVLYGSFDIRPAAIHSNPFLFCLISRRSRFRAGTRYFARGIDSQGNVANFNETEQLVLVNPSTSQPPDVFSYSTYGDTVLVNLVNQVGYEMPVKDAFERAIEEVTDAPTLTVVDAAGSKMVSTSRVRLLTPSEPARHRADKLHGLSGPYNVVQSTIAKGVLEKQLRSVGILEEGEEIQDTEFMPIFRNVWADHADYVSNAYSGSGALKADFTRTGDAFDLMTGSWVARRTPLLSAALLIDKRPLLIRSMPHVAGFSIFMILAGLTLPRTSEYSLVYYHLIWFTFLILSILFIQAHGTAYVAWPRLNASAVRDVLEYDGPGTVPSNTVADGQEARESRWVM
ncbi:SacI homology domain [Rhizoctonia solani]|uniref:SacI homology domain n=1 Tax=Rhizoctonia solani TaxID=456999 RepID=A0A8H7M3R4_9AGAM|nr:SacI homology domain [Rhizoctonia solani]